MLKKRLIGVITVKDGWAVQSFAYGRYLPLGKPECLAENLDRWGADEILVLCIDRSRQRSGPDFPLLQRLSALGLATPLIYCGGIASVADGVRVIQTGADRICVDALLRDDIECVSSLSERLGAQAVVASLPVEEVLRSLSWFDYRQRVCAQFSKEVLSLLSDAVVSEALVIDWRHEGVPNGFNPELIEQFPIPRVPLIAFGGISESGQARQILSMPQVAAIAIGNFLNYREHALQAIKEGLAGLPLRPPAYQSSE